MDEAPELVAALVVVVEEHGLRLGHPARQIAEQLHAPGPSSCRGCSRGRCPTPQYRGGPPCNGWSRYTRCRPGGIEHGATAAPRSGRFGSITCPFAVRAPTSPSRVAQTRIIGQGAPHSEAAAGRRRARPWVAICPAATFDRFRLARLIEAEVAAAHPRTRRADPVGPQRQAIGRAPRRRRRARPSSAPLRPGVHCRPAVWPRTSGSPRRPAAAPRRSGSPPAAQGARGGWWQAIHAERRAVGMEARGRSAGERAATSSSTRPPPASRRAPGRTVHEVEGDRQRGLVVGRGGVGITPLPVGAQRTASPPGGECRAVTAADRQCRRPMGHARPIRAQTAPGAQ